MDSASQQVGVVWESVPHVCVVPLAYGHLCSLALPAWLNKAMPCVSACQLWQPNGWEQRASVWSDISPRW